MNSDLPTDNQESWRGSRVLGQSWFLGASPALPTKLRALSCMHARPLGRVPLFVTSWTVAHQTPLSMGFPRWNDWSGLPFPPSRDLPHPGIKLLSPASATLADGFFTTIPSALPYFLPLHILLFCLKQPIHFPLCSQWNSTHPSNLSSYLFHPSSLS